MTRPFAILLFHLFTTFASLANAQDNQTNVTAMVDVERERCGEIIDMHLHPSNYTSVDPLIAEMNEAGISRAILYAVYASNNTFLPDANTQVDQMLQESNGRMYGLASLDTSGNWSDTRDAEIARLLEYLAKPEFLGTKLAPPHTCLELNGTILPDIIQAVSTSNKPVVGIHTGTTPFCGVFGELILGYRGCCEEQYVDPSFLEPLITEYPNVTFILLHSGFDFLPPDDEFFYNGTLAENAINVAVANDNVWLEISAMFPTEPDGRPRNPSGSAVVQAIKNAGLADRVFYGSDANFPGVMTHSLEWAVPAMISAGFTEDERCNALVDASMNVFGIPPLDEVDDMTSSSSMTHYRTVLMFCIVSVVATVPVLY